MNTSVNSYNIRRESTEKLAALQKAYAKEVSRVKRETYEAWVAAGGKQKDAEAAAVAKKLNKERYKTRNGLTIHGLRQAGVIVTVNHIRYTDIPNVPVLIPVPSYLRKLHDFNPRGGVTHITLVAPDGQSFALTSICAMSDSFDYRMGVKIALDQLSHDDAKFLMSGTEACETTCIAKTCCMAGIPCHV